MGLWIFYWALTMFSKLNFKSLMTGMMLLVDTFVRSTMPISSSGIIAIKEV